MIMSRRSKIFIHAILAVSLILCVYPFFYMVNNSFKSGMEIINYPFSLPKKPTISSYVRVVTELNILRLFFNSFLVAGSVTILNALLNSMVAFSLEKMRFRYRKQIFRLILFTMMIPPIVLLIPTYILLFNLGWKNTYRVLILPGAISAYNIFLLKQFFKQISDTYIEAAKIDGANYFTVFGRIILPMALPALSTVAILSFMASWNDFLGPLLYITDQSLYTIQLGIVKFRALIPGTNREVIYASVLFATVPVILFYLMFQRQFVKAYAGMSLK